MAETSQSISVSPQESNKPVRVLGIDGKEELCKDGFQANQLLDIQQTIRPELEHRLSTKNEALSSFFDPGFSGTLHSTLASQKGHLERESTALELDKDATQRAFWEYYKVLCKILDTTGAILEDYKLKKQYQSDEVTSLWLQSQLQTMMLKLQYALWFHALLTLSKSGATAVLDRNIHHRDSSGSA